MNIATLIESYKNQIIKEFGDMILVLYGSSVYGVDSSDLDICFFSDKDITIERLEKLKYMTRLFHIQNNLKIDEEVPYDNKLIYTKEMVDETFRKPPFPYIDNKFMINPIEKSEEYLSSTEMSKRLLLNILTTRYNVLFGNAKKIEKYSEKAWDTIIRVILSYAEENELTIHELMKLLFEDPYTHATGELYLGYKDNLKEKSEYLENSLSENIKRLEREDVVVKTLTRKYKFNEGWIQNGRKN